jgi:integrase
MSAIKKPLTDTQVRNAKPALAPYRLFDGGGLHLHVSTSGGKLWRMKCRHAGKEQLLSFGQYPAVSLKDARDKRDAAKRQLAKGLSPSSEKKKAALLAKVAQEDTFAKVAKELIAKKEREGMASGTAAKQRWFVKLLDDIGERPISEIEPIELLAVLRRIEASGRYETATRCLEFAGRVFRYGVATARAPRNPAADLKGALTAPKVEHLPAITDAAGAGELMRKIEGYGGRTQTRAALKLMAHLFPRPGELRFAEWPEIDFEAAIWSIPAGRTKMRKAHVIPLSRQALAILRELHELHGGKGFVIRSPLGAKHPISENTLNSAVRGLRYEQGAMTAHGFRSMASTLLNESGRWHADAIERSLAHGPADAVRAAYHRGQHWAERVRMMQWWSDQLDALRDGAQIIELADVARSA